MGMSIRPWKYPLLITLSALILFMFGTVSPARAAEYPAATFSPFAGSQTQAIAGSGQNSWMYPFGTGYLMISYGQGTESNDQDIIVNKLDLDGKAVWQKVYNLTGNDTLTLIHFLSNGFVMAVKSQTKNSSTNRLLQIDSSGNIIWQRDLPLNTVDSIGSTNDQGFIIAGTSGTNNMDIHVIKMDKSGNWTDPDKTAGKWDITYANEGSQRASEIRQLLDADDYNDGYILTGYTDSNTNGGKDVYLMRLNAYGEVEWSKHYGTAYNDEGTTVLPGVDDSNNILGFLVAGNTESRSGDKNMYLFYVDKNGFIQKHPGYQYMADAALERQFGGSGDQITLAMTAVPDSFKDDRKFMGKDIEGNGGCVLVGYSALDQSVLLVRINEFGHVMWQKNLPVPGNDLIVGTIVKGSVDSQDLIYSVSYPSAQNKTLDIYTLQLYLNGVLEDDKAIPQDDQQETNNEAVKWVKKSLKYEALRDISKEIKDLLNLQPVVPVTAGSSKGELEWPDASFYLGNLVIGKADGSGTILFLNGVWYQGAWKNNMFNGQGYLRFPTGESYTGDFKDHMMHGQGVFRWPTGECYSGAFKYNQRDGYGIFTWPGGAIYKGDFSQNKAQGQGSISWPNGEKYEGQMEKGNASGQGTYYFPSGEWYRGELRNLVFTGVGVYHWPSGAFYVGEFKNDRLYGEGYYVWPNGVQQWGYWKDDRYIGINKDILNDKETW